MSEPSCAADLTAARSELLDRHAYGMSRFVNPGGPQVHQTPRTHHGIEQQPASTASGLVHTNRPGPRIYAPQLLVASGPIYALVQPVSYPVETQPPAEALHPEADHEDVVAVAGDFLLVVIVILLAGCRAIVRLVRVR